jgi:protease-4
LGESAEERPVLVSWEQAQKRLLAPLRWRSRQAVGVVSLQGLIVLGPSRRMPLPLPLPLFPSQAGSDTLVQQLRAAAQDKRLGAIVLHVDSPGGSALASDLIWREVLHLRRRKPVVVYMGDRAASGGYYVAAGANAVVAQPTTLTGSIGIWGGKIVTRGLWGMVHARREVAARGGAAGLYADVAPFTAEERAKIRSNLGAGYERFKSRVADGRGLTMAAVEDIARGRVWCGEQGLRNGLVDSLGDLRAAADLACELAGLDPDRYVPLVNVPLPRQHHVPASLPDEATAWWAGFLGLMRGLLALAPWDLRVRQ